MSTPGTKCARYCEMFPGRHVSQYSVIFGVLTFLIISEVSRHDYMMSQVVSDGRRLHGISTRGEERWRDARSVDVYSWLCIGGYTLGV
jgi:hypothetical protein